MKFRHALAAVLLGLFILPAQAAETTVPNFWDAKERLQKPDLSRLPRLLFMTTTDFPPFNYLDGYGRLSGFHVDLARAICAELEISDKCQIQALPWAELDGALRNGGGEAIMAGMGINADNREKYAFSRPYLQFPARFVMPKTTAAKEPMYDQVQGKRIGVMAGTAHEKMLRDYFGGVKVVTYSKSEWLYADLKASKLDGVFGDGMRLAFWLAGTDAAGCCRFAGGPYLAPEHLGFGLAIAVKQEDANLADAFDYALHTLSVKGIFADLYLRYFPVSFF